MAFEDVLATWLVEQRWFAGKGHGLRDLAIVADTPVVAGDPELRHLIVAVSHGTTVDYYQVLADPRRAVHHRPGQPRALPGADQHQPRVRRGVDPQGVPAARPGPQPGPGGHR